MEKWQKIKEKRYLGCLVRETLKTDHGTQAGREENTSPMGVMRAPGFLGRWEIGTTKESSREMQSLERPDFS